MERPIAKKYIKKPKAPKVKKTIAEEDTNQIIFKGADKIFTQILWDTKHDKNEFIVGYEDRFEGVKEEPFYVFEVLKEDIPFHRIRFYKRRNEIVWDRKKKINKL